MNVIIDFRKYIIMLLPVLLRKTKMVGWLESLVSPVKQILNDLQDYINEQLESLKYNGQVAVFSSLLKIKFPDNFIFIEHVNNRFIPKTLIGARISNKNLVLIGSRKNNYRVTIGTRLGGGFASDPNFIVYVVNMTYPSMEIFILISYLNRYAVYDSRYIIQDLELDITIYEKI
jgi:hypothetical protein